MQWKKLDSGQKNVYRWRCERAKILDRLLKEDKRITYAEALKAANAEMRAREKGNLARAGGAEKTPLREKSCAASVRYVIPAGTSCVVVGKTGETVQHTTRKRLEFAQRAVVGALWSFAMEGYTVLVEPRRVRESRPRGRKGKT